MAIDVSELQLEVKTLLKEPTSSYSQTLEAIHLDYMAHTTGKEIRDKSGMPPSLTSSLYRGKVKFDVPM